ncbi:ABC transporter permease [Skermania piniformis]|uniref:ABC transporter permease n=1 Tax=Skermania pinensis TaxID=39122 RepID=A0ABX8SG48_9ACTN|nr:ABC transporter permease [Skermania piniformis]QXQ14656.1 ABC transporter permease [Skermania piniformis]
MNLFGAAWTYFREHWWSGEPSLLELTGQHLWYTLLAVTGAAVVAIPIGLAVGHTGRGRAGLIGAVNALRALPTLGLLTFLVLWLGSIGLTPPIVALIVAGIPALLAGTYAGIANVDPTVVDAARAMGMTERQVLLQAELPNALPLILGGLRSTTLQVVSTATIAAYIDLGGLGRPIFSGIAVRQYDRVLAAAILVALLAVVLDGLLALVARLARPRSGRRAATKSTVSNRSEQSIHTC